MKISCHIFDGNIQKFGLISMHCYMRMQEI